MAGYKKRTTYSKRGLGVARTKRPYKASFQSPMPMQVSNGRPRPQEKKWHDTHIGVQSGSTNVSYKEWPKIDWRGNTAGAESENNNPTLVDIIQGSGQTSRIGRKITVTSVDIRGSFELDKETTSNVLNQKAPSAGSRRVRMIVYYDRQCNGADAKLLDILDTTNINSYNNLDNSMRFKILKNKVYLINRTSHDGTNSFSMQRQFKCHIKGPIEIQYSGASGVLSEITSGNIGIWFITDGNGGNGGNETQSDLRVQYVSRVRYTDN